MKRQQERIIEEIQEFTAANPEPEIKNDFTDDTKNKYKSHDKAVFKD